MTPDAPKTPPRFVPTLTEVVQPSLVAAQALSPALSTDPVVVSPEALEDQILHRVMQRVDLSLERRLREGVAAVVLQHTQALMPRLREEIECVVRRAVAEAVAEELAIRQT